MHRTSLFLLFMLIVTSFSLYASEEPLPTMQELVDNHEIRLKSWLSSETINSDKKNDSAISINQSVILFIDISTPRWFTDGTVIENISIQNILAQQRNLQATNYSQMEGDQTWSHQRWEIPLFPQKTGQFMVPSIGIKITVSVATGKNVRGILFTQPHRFSAQRPTANMTTSEVWVIAPNANLTQHWQYSTSQNNKKEKQEKNKEPQLTVGDAITRTLTLHASDSLAMLLPTLIPNLKNSAVQRYTDPEQLKDSNNRGQHSAVRKESETYILQRGGEITLPEIAIPFWNTTTQRSEQLIVKGQTIHIKHTLISWLKAYSLTLFFILFMFVSSLFLFNKLRHYYQSHPYPDWLLFFRATKRHSSPEIRLYLYRRLFKKTELLELKKYQINNQDEWNANSETLQQSTLSPRKLWQLWFKIKNSYKPKISLNSRFTRKLLNINII